MKTPVHSLIAVFLAAGLLCGLPACASDPAPANFAEAELTAQAQGVGETATTYQQQFLLSVARPLNAAMAEGIAALGKSGFDAIFIVAADGRIKNVLPSDPGRQPLGRYVAAKMVGVQAAKPPRDGWSVYVSMERSRKPPVPGTGPR